MKLALLPARLAKFLRLDRLLPQKLREPLDLVPDDISAYDVPEFSPSSAQPSKGRLGFVRGCVMSVMFGETNRATVALLNRAGYDVIAPRNQVCCGALHAHSGRLDQARSFARENIRAFREHSLDAIIINAAGCGSTLKEYGHLLELDPEWHEAGRDFSAKIKDITEFLVGAGIVQRLQNALSSLGTVTYHDACHLAHPQRITQPPRQLVRAVAGQTYVELPESEVCCGSAGTYNLTEPEMAERLQRRKIENILRSKAQTVVTTNPGCILQIRAGLAKANRKDIQVLHISDFLEPFLRPE
jgi:glycolate oxidase iron-sulfur subunit